MAAVPSCLYSRISCTCSKGRSHFSLDLHFCPVCPRDQIHPEILQPEVFFLSQFSSEQELYGNRISGQVIDSLILAFHVYSADFQEMIQHFTRVTAAGKSDRQFLRIDLFYPVSIGLIKAGGHCNFLFSIYLLFSISNSFSGCNNIRKFYGYQWNLLLFRHFLKMF